MIAEQVAVPDFDGLRVQVPGEHQIWLVFGDQRHYITGLDVLHAIFRNEEKQLDPNCALLPIGAEIGPGSCLVRSTSGGDIYLLVKPSDGPDFLHLVISPEQFDRYGFAENKIVELSEEILRSIPIGPPLGTSAASLAYIERENVEKLAWALLPERPTLLLLLEEISDFTTQFATQIFETARRRVNVLVGWIEGERLVVSASVSGATDGPTCRLDPTELNSAAERLRIARVDLLATHFSPATMLFVTAIGRNFDLTPLSLPDGSKAAQDLIRHAARVIACGDSVLTRLRFTSPELPIELGLDPEVTKPNRFRVHPAQLAEDEELRVLIWGPMFLKSEKLVADTVAISLDRKLPFRFFTLDCGTARQDASPIAGVRDLGALGHLDLNTLVCVLRPHLVWFLEPYPDVFDFRASTATAQGLPILASEDCSFRSRLATRPYTWWLQPGLSGEHVASRLLEIRDQWSDFLEQSRTTSFIERSFYPNQYLDWPPSESVPQETPISSKPSRTEASVADQKHDPAPLRQIGQSKIPALKSAKNKLWPIFK